MAVILTPFNGPVKVYVKAIPTTGTNNPVTTNTFSFALWTDLGYQYQGDKGVTVEIKTDVDDVKVMGFNSPIQRDIIGESVTVSVEMLKTSWEKLSMWGIPGMTRTEGQAIGTNPNVYSVGGLSYMKEFSLGIAGINDLGYGTCLYVPKVNMGNAANLNFKKGPGKSYEFKFDALADTLAASGAQLFTLTEITGITALDPEAV